MATVSDLIKSSLRLIGAIAAGESPTSSESSDALTALNDMMEAWATEHLAIYAETREEASLVAGTQTYTMGTAGTFSSTRAVKIERAAIEVQASSPYEIPIDILNLDEWARISDKALTSDIPTKLYHDGAYPAENLSLWPVPSDTNKLVIYSLKPISSFAAISDSVALPPGYSKALRYNLALELAPEYGKEAPATVVQGAIESKANIKRQNIRPRYLKCDVPAGTRPAFDINVGE